MKKNNKKRNNINKIKTKPKVLLWDLETGFNQVNIFSLWDAKRGISPDALLSERYIICGSFTYLDDDEIRTFYVDYENPTDDEAVVRDLHKVLSDADAIIAHYGDNYDIKFFNSRALYWGLPPIHNVIQIDTYKIAKKHFLFNSNKLDYLGEFLGIGRKKKTTRELWQRCYDGDEEAIEEMVSYCEMDVVLLEKVYLKLRPYTEAKLNRGHFTKELVCPSCGSDKVHRRGYFYTRVGKRAKYVCLSCNSWSSSRVSEKVEGPQLK